MKERIGLNDSTMDILMKMSEGNPGALTVLMRMLKEGEGIDPQSFAGGFGAILNMDSRGIYGTRIWSLYKYVSGEDLVSMIAVLRACQMGLVHSSVLDAAIDNHGKGIDVPAIVASVKERLPAFGIAV